MKLFDLLSTWESKKDSLSGTYEAGVIDEVVYSSLFA